MIKKLLFIIMIALGWTFTSTAHTTKAVIIPLEIINDSEIGDDDPKSPQLQYVVQDVNVLSMYQTSSNLVLQLRNDTGTVVYSVNLPVGTTQVVLPVSLAGLFELRLVADTYYYIGYIVL